MSEVIDLKSRQRLENVEALVEAQIEEDRQSVIDRQVEMLERLIDLVKDGRIDGFVIAGRNPATGRFLTDISFPMDGCDANEAAAYASVLDVLRQEFLEIVADGPAMLIDGSFIYKHKEDAS